MQENNTKNVDSQDNKNIQFTVSLKPKYLIIVLLVLIIPSLIFAGYKGYEYVTEKQTPTNTPTPYKGGELNDTVTPTETPTNTPEPSDIPTSTPIPQVKAPILPTNTPIPPTPALCSAVNKVELDYIVQEMTERGEDLENATILYDDAVNEYENCLDDYDKNIVGYEGNPVVILNILTQCTEKQKEIYTNMRIVMDNIVDELQDLEKDGNLILAEYPECQEYSDSLFSTLPE